MTRMDPLTQTMTVPNVSAPPRVTQAPDHATAPAEAVSRFVPAIDRGAETNTLEAGYAAVRVRRRMTCLQNMDTLSHVVATECVAEIRGRKQEPVTP